MCKPECNAVPTKKQITRGRPKNQLVQYDRPSAHERSFPPSLSRVRSEFKILCDELGGPADLGVKVNSKYMELCCREYPLDSLLPTLLKFHKDNIKARRHWPWAAFAVDQYVFEKSERSKYTEEPKSKEIIELLKQIQQSACKLGSGLSQLQNLSHRLFDTTAPFRRVHLAWLDEFVSQYISGRIRKDVGEHDGEILANHFKKIELLRQLSCIELGAKKAAELVDDSLLERERGQSDPALPNFVFRCAAIWSSLTERKPSANKVHRHPDRNEPDFVIFVQDLAKFAKQSPPSRDKVATSLRQFRTGN
jgi:hypothetical protein